MYMEIQFGGVKCKFVEIMLAKVSLHDFSGRQLVDGGGENKSYGMFLSFDAFLTSSLRFTLFFSCAE
jgi:hypothetical protein